MKKTYLEKYSKIVDMLSEFSKEEKLKVGCIILKNDRIVSTGYNGGLPGKESKAIEDIKGNTRNKIHAEQNALMNCAKNGISTNNCICIVSHFPCEQCTKLLIMSGIKKIYFNKDYKNDENIFVTDIEIEKIRGM